MLTLTTLCADYLEHRRHDLEDSTKETALRACRWFDLARGRKAVDRIDKQDGEKFKSWLVDTGRQKTTANIYLRAIQPIMNYAVEKKLIALNPLREVREFRVTQKPPRIYEDWQFERMLRYVPKPDANDPLRDKRWKAILWCARVTGLRAGALLNLTPDNIRNGFIWVEAKKRTEHTWPWEPKDKELRRVPLIPQLAEALEPFREFWYVFLPARIYKRLLALQETGLLTSRLCKRPMGNFRRTFVGIQRRAFGRQIGDFHQFRRTFTSQLADELPDYVVLDQTGLSNAKTLTHYRGVRKSHYILVFNCLAKTLNGASGLQSTAERRSAV